MTVTDLHNEASGDSHDDHPEGNTRLFLKVFAALCVLTAVSFAIANSPLMNSKVLGWSSMMAVSCAKAFLVISFFMHLRWERTWKYVLTIPASIMAVLLVVSLVPDIGMRARGYTQSRWLHASENPVSEGEAADAAEVGEDTESVSDAEAGDEGA